MNPYFNVDTGRICTWDQDAQALKSSRCEYLKTGEAPNEKPMHVHPRMFPLFSNIIMDEFRKIAKDAKNPLCVVFIGFDTMGRLMWVFGREDKKLQESGPTVRNREFEAQIDSAGAADMYNYSDGTLRDGVRSMLTQLDNQAGG